MGLDAVCIYICYCILNKMLCNPFLLGTKRIWMPDETEAYTEVEIRELNGDKTTVETKDGRVSQPANSNYSICCLFITII